MPASDISVLDYWRKSAEIDYFSQYIKAYLAFNALMRIRNPDSKKDRDLIDAIKTSGGKVKSEFSRSINNRVADSDLLLSHLGQLHSHLERAEITANDSEEVISFTKVRLGDASEIEIASLKSIEYKIEREGKKINIKITDRSQNIVSFSHGVYSLPSLNSNSNFTVLDEDAKGIIGSLYLKFDPNAISNLIVNDGGIETPSCKFDGTNDKLYRGVVEILYSLRCALFHGRVVPDGENAKVYEFAYLILRKLIHSQ